MAVGIYKLEENDSGEWIATLLNETVRISSDLSMRFGDEAEATKFVDRACPGHKRVTVDEFDKRHKDLFG